MLVLFTRWRNNRRAWEVSQLKQNQPILLILTQAKINKESNGVELLFPVSWGEFVSYFPKYSSIFSQDKALVWAVSYVIVSSFFVSVHSQTSRNNLGRRQEGRNCRQTDERLGMNFEHCECLCITLPHFSGFHYENTCHVGYVASFVKGPSV